MSFDTLDTYGKEPEQLKNINKLFQIKLANFTWKQIEDAFGMYLNTGTAMPKPADIISIIEPKPVWCKLTFQEIRKKQIACEFVTDDEYRYCEEFIAAHVAKGVNV